MKVTHSTVVVVPDDSAYPVGTDEWNAVHLAYQTYYVSPTGNDSNDGVTTTSAWKTIAKVNAATLSPGDAVLFQGGQTFSGALVNPGGGTAANPVSFGSYGGGKATISSGTSNGFTSTNFSGVIVRDLIFTGSASTNHGIRFDNTLSSNVHLQNVQAINCKASGYGLNGIHVTGSNGAAGYDNVLIDGCEASGNCTVAPTVEVTSGILVLSTAGTGLSTNGATFNNVKITNCYSHNNVGTTGPTWSGGGINCGEVINGLIFNCLSDTNGHSSNAANLTGPVGISVYDCKFFTIDSCISKNNGTANLIDGEGFDLDGGCVNCTIQNCYSENNAAAGFLLFAFGVAGGFAHDGNAILNCISVNDGSGAGNTIPSGFAVANTATAPLTNCRIYGNTVYQSGSTTSAIGFPDFGGLGSVTGEIRDNTFIISAAQPFIFTFGNPSGLSFDANRYISAGDCLIYWNGVAYTDVATWAGVTGQEAVATPNFIGINAAGAYIKAALLFGWPTDLNLWGSSSLFQEAIAGSASWAESKYWFNNNANGAASYYTKSRATTPGGLGIVQTGDQLGGIFFGGDDGASTTYSNAAAGLEAIVVGAPAAGSIQGQWKFSAAGPGESAGFAMTGKLTIDYTKVAVLPTTASTSTTTGALTVAGGAGVAGDVFCQSVATSVVASSALPAAAAGNKGMSMMVSDANATTFWSVVASGGGNIIRVTSDGTNWRIG